MTKMYIDFSVESKIKSIPLDDFFTFGKINKIDKGCILGKRHKIADYYEWQLYTEQIDCIDTNDLLVEFYNLCKKNIDKIVDVIKSVEGKSYICVVIDRGENDNGDFSVSIAPEMIDFLYKINASFCIDGIYQ